MTMRFIEKFVDGLSSIWLSCTLLTLLGLLTWLGTVAGLVALPPALPGVVMPLLVPGGCVGSVRV